MKEILNQYRAHVITAEEANAELAKIEGCTLFIDPLKNVIREDEPENIFNGFGMLNSGTGTLDKVKLVNGALMFPLFNPEEFIGADPDSVPTGFVDVAGVPYRVGSDGKTLENVE